MSTQKEYSVEELIAEASSLIKSLKKDDEQIKPEETPAMEASQPAAPEASQSQEQSAPAAPEASQEQSPAEQLAAEPQEQQEEDLGSLVQSLEDDALQELAEVISQELEARHSQSQPQEQSAPAAPAMEASQAQAPQAPEASPVKEEEQSAFKAELAVIKDQLKKSEDQNKKLMEFVGKTTETLAKAASMPKPKAVTSIEDMKYVDNSSLAKSETSAKDATDKLNAIGKDMKTLKTLTKRELSDLNEFYQTKQLNDKVLKLINK